MNPFSENPPSPTSRPERPGPPIIPGGNMADLTSAEASSRSQAALQRAMASHQRHWEQLEYVYPVLSRRSHGLSIGINLNPDMACNFDCVYCMVDRQHQSRPTAGAATVRDVDLDQVRQELAYLLLMTIGGQIWDRPPFRDVPAEYRRLNDIAFSGNGEPTIAPCFAQAVDLVLQLRQLHCRGWDMPRTGVKVVLITNATALHQPAVAKALAKFDPVHDEIWAKLDAGSERDYQMINRSRVPLEKVLRNILAVGRMRPIVIQSLLAKLHGHLPGEGQFGAYLDRLEGLLAYGCRIHTVQLYTTARRTAETFVTPLTNMELHEFALRLRRRLPHVEVEIFGPAGCDEPAR